MTGFSQMMTGKRIIVVGGAGFLGSKIVEAIVAAGATCSIADVSTERAAEVALTVESRQGVRPIIQTISITDRVSVDSAIEECAMALGGIDGLINTAYPRNSHYGRRFEDVSYTDFSENISLHLGGYFLVSQRILEWFKARGGGSLLNISSIYGVVAPRFEVYEGTTMTMPVEYAAIKAGLIHLTRYMAKYYAGHGIRVNCLSLGGLRDRQPDAFINNYRGLCLDKGMLDPEDIVGTVVFIMSNSAQYLNGQNIIVDDGFCL